MLTVERRAFSLPCHECGGTIPHRHPFVQIKEGGERRRWCLDCALILELIDQEDYDRHHPSGLVA